ncbi:transposase [Gaoshiqia sediminis]|uniref:Transposase IS200-like domain-containing protein n=1 Tax=Gaoshiqia sediminis TaxID=2986998 RepID=A0AA41Y5H8_9BACT|nr:transposase [Gaoshiqia sediminis]MCW0483794.1 hypothetical protein [Gaoshiqia sediminis]
MDFHNRRNIRLPNHDYSQPCSYFVTINIKLGQCLFGRASSPTEIQHSPLGKVAGQCWLSIPDHFPHVQLDEFVVMPNHLHGIIHLGNPPVTGTLPGYGIPWPYAPDENRNVVSPESPVRSRQIVTYGITPPTKNHFGPLPKGSLGVVIGQYKSAVTRWANNNRHGGLFSWHSRFYDRIITDKEALHIARIYIRQNTAKWWEKYGENEW